MPTYRLEVEVFWSHVYEIEQEAESEEEAIRVAEYDRAYDASEAQVDEVTALVVELIPSGEPSIIPELISKDQIALPGLEDLVRSVPRS